MRDKEQIIVDKVSKEFKVVSKNMRSTNPTLKDDLGYILHNGLKKMGMSAAIKKDSFYALDNVSFSVNKGDVVGLIGKNGSGKSTLLKIISRITSPSSGQITLAHKPSSLLEVGTGFHPELTGRENVYFNGTILGMTKKEIDSKFDEIVAFSGVEKFIETPIKYYSSGMTVRLAFSVAAFLDPEILLIDEVLAVGDINFKKKSLERTKSIAASGATVLFVSHQIGQLKSICTRGVVLDEGRVVKDTGIDEAIEKYLSLNQEPESLEVEAQSGIRIASASASAKISSSGLPQLKIAARVIGEKNYRDKIYAVFTITDALGSRIHQISSINRSNGLVLPHEESAYRLTVDYDHIPLPPGEYRVRVDVHQSKNNELIDSRSEGFGFNIPNYDFLDYVKDNSGQIPHNELLIPFRFDAQKVKEK